MADNYAFTPGTGATGAADDVGGVLYPRVKVSVGADGVAADWAVNAGVVGATVPRVTVASDDAITVSLGVMDDWDESDRAKVNIITGQAGISAGAGAVAANTPRVTLASDDPAVGHLATLVSAIQTEDLGHSSGDKGVMMLGVRKDTGGALAGTDLDYAPFQLDANGYLRVNVAAGSSAGTEYTEDAAAAADPVGGALILVRKDTLAGLTSADGDNVAARGTDKGELYVKHVDAIPVTDNGGSLTVDGTVTVNAGTNLNTSALALESGGNLAAIAASASVLDDWDESDRAKVNLIVGQAGIAAGAGSVGATVPRVTLASDDPAVASLSVLDDWDESDRAKVNLIPGVAGIDGNSGNKSSATVRVVIATDQPTMTNAQPVSNTHLSNFGAGEYETVAASQTAQVLGSTGAAGDYLAGVLIIPASTSPGNVIILDNATSITIFAGGASSVSNLVPFFVPLGIISVNGAWKITTGSNVSAIGIGNFT